MMNIVIIGVGGFVGAVARYALALWIGRRWGRTFPSARFAVNVSGSFLIGLLMTLMAERFTVNPQWRLLLIVVTYFSGIAHSSAVCCWLA